MFEYKISIDKRVIAILGPHLYGDTASIIAELVSNSYDADADNCWVTIRTGASPEIIIEDDGIGMTPEEVNKYFLDIGYDRRDERPVTKKNRKVFGRKGIGKLAAFSLAKTIELHSEKDGNKAGCILDFDKITKEGRDPDAIPENRIFLTPQRLSSGGTGTRLVLKEIQKNINTTYYHLVNRIIRNFNVDLTEFRIHIAKNDELPRTVDFADLNFFSKMDTIVTIGDTYKQKADEVRNNDIEEKYKMVAHYDDDPKRFPQMPRSIEVLDKKGQAVKVDFAFEGWIGTIVNKGELRKLMITGGASKEEEDNISISDNRITVFSRKRIGEYDVLPKVQTDTIYDAYVIGEVHVHIFEDDYLADMAISNRRGYEETDQRYQALIDYLKQLIRYIVQRKAEVQDRRRKDQDKEESDKTKQQFIGKTRTMEILKNRLEEEERDTVVEEYAQFVRAARLAQSTKKILISHAHENKEYGFFIMRIFELLGMDVANALIFTSHSETGVPHGVNIYDYLKDCFREDIYVIFLFSRDFYDSNICIAETGAAWATNRNHSNVIIDIGYGDIDKPIDNAKCGLSMKSLDTLDRDETIKFIEVAYTHAGLTVPEREKILSAIEKAISEFNGKLKAEGFYPRRRYQGHPVCDSDDCGNTMDMTMNGGVLHYECRTPKCAKTLQAKVY